MEISLPNLQRLEKRIEQLSEEIVRLRERNAASPPEAGSLPEETKDRIENKIRNLLHLLDEF